MKAAEQRVSESRRQHVEAMIARHLAGLFQRLPMLCGFWLAPELDVAEVSVFTWPGHTPGRELYEEVTQSLADLAEERPEALQIMRGRTFARAVH